MYRVEFKDYDAWIDATDDLFATIEEAQEYIYECKIKYPCTKYRIVPR